MKKGLLIAIILAVAVTALISVNQFVVRSAGEESDAIMRVMPDECTLRHPRRGHSMTIVGDKIWITGGRSYMSHWDGWGKNGHEKWVNYPNYEYMDLKTKKTYYTDIKGPKDIYKSTVMRTPLDPTILYMAGEGALYKFDTVARKLTKIKDPGVKGEYNKGVTGLMTIKGKQYVVLVGVKQIFFFDYNLEKFVDIPGVSNKWPMDSNTGAMLNNKMYLFGGNETGTDEGGNKAFVFDPNAPEGQQMLNIRDLPVPLGGPPKSIVYKNKIYIFGGTSGGDFVDTVMVYDPAKDTYSARHPLPRGTMNHAVVLHKNKVYITYGYAWGNEVENKVGFRVHPALTLEYNIKADKPNKSGSLATSIKGDKMNVVISYSDAGKITGSSQTIGVNWQASTAATKGTAFIREKGATAFTPVPATGINYIVGLAEAKGYYADFTGLKPSTSYEYYVVSEGKTEFKSPVYTFKTNPENPSSFIFCAYGDSKAQYDVCNELNGEILKQFKAQTDKGGAVAFNIMLGDFGSIGAIPEYNAWFNFAWKVNYSKEMVASYPFFLSHGNHESLVGTYFNSFNFPTRAMPGWPDLNNRGNEELWFSFNYGPAHFIEYTQGYIGTEWDKRQLEWFKQDLATAKQMKEAGLIKWVIVMQHHSMMSTSEHFLDHNLYGYMAKGSYVDTIMDSGVVDLVLGAHDHNYERSKSMRGVKWVQGEPNKFVKEPGAYVDDNSGRFGTASKGKGTIWMTLGGAGAGQRDCIPRADLGYSDFIAHRKPDPDKGESAGINPAFFYGIFTVSDQELKIEIFEKNISYLPGAGGEGGNFVDDSFEGLLDSVVIK